MPLENGHDYRAEAEALRQASPSELRAFLLTCDMVEQAVRAAASVLRPLRERESPPPPFGGLLADFIRRWAPTIDSPGFDRFQDELHNLLRAAKELNS